MGVTGISETSGRSGIAQRVHDSLRRAPRWVKWPAQVASPLADPLLTAAYRRRSGDRSTPIPPTRMRVAVGMGPDIGEFVESGRRVAGQLLEPVREELAAGGPVRALDFACGCGRVLPHVVAALPDGSEVAGTDVDRRAIGWLRRRVANDRFFVNGYAPPLPFEPQSFGLVYTISSFTHLTEADQDLWLEELARVAQPGVPVIATTNGPAFLERYDHGRDLLHPELVDRIRSRDLEAEGFVFEPYTDSVASRGRHTDSAPTYGITFHDPAYVRERWSAHFDVIAIDEGAINAGQDRIVLRRRA